jgi:cell division initiation protein
MAITPLEIQKMRFPRRLQGVDATEVGNFLLLVAEELAARLGEIDRLQTENAGLRERLASADERERALQEMLLRAQKLADEIAASAEREAHLVRREAELAADKLMSQAIEQATHLEARISELVVARKEMHGKCKAALELFAKLLDADIEEERSTATVHILPRVRRSRAE